jgi:formylglycine-generating enzyme required for sulfatase activity
MRCAAAARAIELPPRAPGQARRASGNHHPGCAAVRTPLGAGQRASLQSPWFQANLACANSGKRLPSNAEWQMAATGSPDPGGDNGTTDCNTGNAFHVVATGSRSGCVSAFGAFDMVGNLYEWVADWVPQSTTCGSWSGSGDDQCLAGAATTGEPSALLRGGNFTNAAGAGPLAVNGDYGLSSSFSGFGFRCAR